MSISTLRAEVEKQVRSFAWEQWAQMGVLAQAERRDRWAADPEALLLFTLEVGRDDPRLFDEVLDWLVVNERIVSVQRLRNLARDDDHRTLVDAALAWVSRWRPRARLTGKTPRGRGARARAEPLFRASGGPIREPDEAFLERGLLKPRAEPSGKSQPPDAALPVNFAFRLRHLLGVGARAEAVRILLGVDAPRVSVQVVAASAGYAKRNVHEALASLRAAGVVDLVEVGSDRRFGTSREGWGRLLGLAPRELPVHRDWPALLYALRRIVRWLADPRTAELSDYMRASDARQLIHEIEADFRFAGVPIVDRGARGAEYWDDFVATVRNSLAALE